MNRDVGYVSWHVREISTAIFINHALTMAFEHKTTFINGKPLISAVMEKVWRSRKRVENFSKGNQEVCLFTRY